MNAPFLLTEEEAAKQLLVHPRTLRKLRQAGEIRYVALAGRKIAYRPEDCLAYVESRVRLQEVTDTRRKSTRRPMKDSNVLSFTARRRERQEARGR